MLSDLSRPTIFAHRGASAHAPENTLASFELALRQGAEAIELDAKLSADGQVVVIHDSTVDRTTTGHGKVRELPLSALKKLDAGSHFDVAFRGESIPTLEEVFVTVGHKTFINIELTNYASPTDELPIKVAELIQQHRLEQRVLLSSFNPRALRHARQLLPDVPIGLLALAGLKGMWARTWLGRIVIPYQALHPELSDVTSGLVESIHRRGKRVHVYTVNNPLDMLHLFILGVDGIFTDDPALAKQVLRTIDNRRTETADK
jgi:glycerophosphoryl diester phosphodiesterase